MGQDMAARDEGEPPSPPVAEDGPDETGTRARRGFLRRRPPRPRKKLAEILAELAADETRERVSIADIVTAMHGRAFGALMLIFAVPNALPAIPGTSGILGLPLLFLSAQMMLGREPWLPKVISNRSVMRTDFAALVARVNPWLDWADRFTAPRLQWLVGGAAQRFLGLFCLLLSAVLILPIPLGNMLPAFAICLIALGVLERDGLWVLAGILAGLLAVIVVWGVILALATAAWFVVVNAF
jgi:hypothetical protein